MVFSRDVSMSSGGSMKGVGQALPFRADEADIIKSGTLGISGVLHMLQNC